VVGDPVNSDFMDAPRGVHTLICPALSFTGREDVDGLLELRQATEGRIKRMSLTESFVKLEG
jgi:hypothetical protein